MADSLYRQWTLLQLIPRYPNGIKIPQIIIRLEQANIEVPTYRTVQRDLNVLASVFPLLQSEKKEGAHYWSIQTEEGLIEIPKMESPTALAFYLAEKNLQNQLPPSALKYLQPHFKVAKGLLDRHQTEYSDWRDKIRVLPQTQQLIAPEILADVLDVIYQALLENKRFESKYYGRREDQYKKYMVNPIALVLRGTVTYLVCTLRDYTDIRLLSLHRFVDAKLMDRDRWVPAGFSVDDYLKEGHSDFLINGSIDLELKIEEEVAIHLKESKLTDNQQIISADDGMSIFKAHVRDTGQLRWWLLGFGEQIEILKPIELRNEFTQKTAAMAQKYK